VREIVGSGGRVASVTLDDGSSVPADVVVAGVAAVAAPVDEPALDVPVESDEESPPQAASVRVVRAAATSDNTPPRRRMVLGMHWTMAGRHHVVRREQSFDGPLCTASCRVSRT
jgi:3-phenylpropionate/trans-cinnamate dioxygenase ferredoxin reductase subunit